MTETIPRAPDSFDGNLCEFFDTWAQTVLLPVNAVENFHARLVEYVRSADPIHLVRYVKGTERSTDIRTTAGDLLRPTDNSPSWAVHQALYLGADTPNGNLDAFLRALPCHMFKVRGENISTAGWHVAHIFEAKNRDTDFMNWSWGELLRRMVRNLHPCNYFYLPKTNWHTYGGDRDVIAFFYWKFAKRYESIWPDFIRLVAGIEPPKPGDPCGFRFRMSIETLPERDFDTQALSKRRRVQGVLKQPTPPLTTPREPVSRPRSTDSRCGVSYTFSRLCFKADLIEPVAWDDAFCVITRDDGTFRFTKRDFYKLFPKVPVTKSYREARIYHFPSVPERALPYRIAAVCQD